MLTDCTLYTLSDLKDRREENVRRAGSAPGSGTKVTVVSAPASSSSVQMPSVRLSHIVASNGGMTDRAEDEAKEEIMPAFMRERAARQRAEAERDAARAEIALLRAAPGALPLSACI